MKLDRTWTGTPWLRGELDRPQREHPPAGRGHLEHLVVGDARQHPGVGHDPRIGGEHAGDVGVDLAGLGAQRGGERDRGRVGAAPAERRDVGAVETPWKPATTAMLPGVERVPEPAGADVEDLGLAVRRVGDDPGLGAGEADRAGTPRSMTPCTAARSRSARPT